MDLYRHATTTYFRILCTVGVVSVAVALCGNYTQQHYSYSCTQSLVVTTATTWRPHHQHPTALFILMPATTNPDESPVLLDQTENCPQM